MEMFGCFSFRLVDILIDTLLNCRGQFIKMECVYNESYCKRSEGGADGLYRH